MAFAAMTSRETGYKVTAAVWNQIVDNFAALGGAWTGYTPTAAAIGTAWTAGNATISGAYTRINKRLIGRASYLVGSTTTQGAGRLTLTLPAVGDNTITTQVQACAITVWDDSAGYPFARAYSAAVDANTLTIVTNVASGLGALATNDNIAVYFDLELA